MTLPPQFKTYLAHAGRARQPSTPTGTAAPASDSPVGHFSTEHADGAYTNARVKAGSTHLGAGLQSALEKQKKTATTLARRRHQSRAALTKLRTTVGQFLDAELDVGALTDMQAAGIGRKLRTWIAEPGALEELAALGREALLAVLPSNAPVHVLYTDRDPGVVEKLRATGMGAVHDHYVGRPHIPSLIELALAHGMTVYRNHEHDRILYVHKGEAQPKLAELKAEFDEMVRQLDVDNTAASTATEPNGESTQPADETVVVPLGTDPAEFPEDDTAIGPGFGGGDKEAAEKLAAAPSTDGGEAEIGDIDGTAGGAAVRQLAPRRPSRGS